jgi:hypothetical protein
VYGRCCACLCVVLADITTCVCTVTTFHHAQVAPHAVICYCCAQELLQAGAHAGVPQTVPHSGFGTRPKVFAGHTEVWCLFSGVDGRIRHGQNLCIQVSILLFVSA